MAGCPVSWAFGDRRWEGYLPAAEVPSVVARGTASCGPQTTAPSAERRWRRSATRATRFRPGPPDPRRPGRACPQLETGRSRGTCSPCSWTTARCSWRDGERCFSKPSAPRWSRARRRGRPPSGRCRNGRAGRTPDSVSYRIVRAFRQAVAHRVFDPIFAPCVDLYPDFSWSRLNYEEPLETLLKSGPGPPTSSIPFQAPGTTSWSRPLDDVSASLARAHVDPGAPPGARRNTAQIEHPLAGLLPRWASGWLAMPADPLPGDENMPRVQEPLIRGERALRRLAGPRGQGIFQMPGGQCATPSRPYFRAGPRGLGARGADALPSRARRAHAFPGSVSRSANNLNCPGGLRDLVIAPSAHEEKAAQPKCLLRRRALQPEAPDRERLPGGGHLREVARAVPLQLPQDFDPRGTTPRTIRDHHIRSLVGCDLALFSFDGPDLDSGTLAEFMIAKFADIPSVILRSDRRGAGGRTSQWNPMANFYPAHRDPLAGRPRRLQGDPQEAPPQARRGDPARGPAQLGRRPADVRRRRRGGRPRVRPGPGTAEPVMPRHLREEVYNWLP
jgi:nucleoside 2-deoxyribosyltransferase